ncbi:late histone H2B.L4-like [Panthera tigris]|uniref:late histone H2B.L4-like n=1 Tax=Panthera tigris TaxID=9694 RepID=UPI001C6FAF2A|nr:late histone H2B.L4-like [Panthera tigris]
MATGPKTGKLTLRMTQYQIPPVDLMSRKPEQERTSSEGLICGSCRFHKEEFGGHQELALRGWPFSLSSPAAAPVRILKQSQEGLALLQEAMSVIVSLLTDILERIVGVASRLAHSTKHSTITSKEIQRAMRLLLLREFGKHVVSEATKAVIRYTT